MFNEGEFIYKIQEKEDLVNRIKEIQNYIDKKEKEQADKKVAQMFKKPKQAAKALLTSPKKKSIPLAPLVEEKEMLKRAILLFRK